MLTHLNWTSLETHRQHNRLTMMNKMTKGLAAVQYQHHTSWESITPHRIPLFPVTTVTRTFHEQYENGTTCPQTLPRPHPCPHSEEGWPTCKLTQPVFIHTHALLHYYSHSCTLHTTHPVHNLQPIEVRAVFMMKMV